MANCCANLEGIKIFIPDYIADEILCYKSQIEEGIISEEELANALIAGYEKKKKDLDDEIILEELDYEFCYEFWEPFYESIREYEIKNLLLAKTLDLLKANIDEMQEDEIIMVPKQAWDELQDYFKESNEFLASEYYKMGIMYQNGEDGVTQDDKEAIECYRIAAERGHMDAQNRLSAMLI